MSKNEVAVATQQNQVAINWEDSKVVDVIKSTVAAGTTNEEFSMFAEFCKGTGLNPFKKEIWCIVTGKGQYRKVQMMTGINGFYAIANSHPQFDGVENDYGPMKEIELRTPEKKKIKVPEWIECKVYRKDRSRPQMFRAVWEEFHQDLVTRNGYLSIWAQKPSLMLEKCAESMALRKAFPQELNGMYTSEEMPSNFSSEKAEVIKPKQEPFIPDEIYWSHELQNENSEWETYRLSDIFHQMPKWFEENALPNIDKFNESDSLALKHVIALIRDGNVPPACSEQEVFTDADIEEVSPE